MPCWIGLALWFVVRERDLDAGRLLALGTAAAIAAVAFVSLLYPAFSADALPLATPGYQEAVLYSYRWWDYFVPSVVPHAIGGYELAFAAVAGVVLLRYDARIRFSFYRRHPSLLVLAGEPTGASDRELASDFTNVLELVNARFVAVHRDLMDANQLAAIDRLIGSNARLVVWKREGDLAVFRRQ